MKQNFYDIKNKYYYHFLQYSRTDQTYENQYQILKLKSIQHSNSIYFTILQLTNHYLNMFLIIVSKYKFLKLTYRYLYHSIYNAVRLYICSKRLQYQINDNRIYLWLILLLFQKILIIKKYYI